MSVMSYSERTDDNDTGIYKSRMDICGGGPLDARKKFRTLDLQYQQMILIQRLKAKVIKFSCVTLPTVYVWGLLYVGIFSHFWRE